MMKVDKKKEWNEKDKYRNLENRSRRSHNNFKKLLNEKTRLIIITSQPISKFNERRFGLKANMKNFSKEFCRVYYLNIHLYSNDAKKLQKSSIIKA